MSTRSLAALSLLTALGLSKLFSGASALSDEPAQRHLRHVVLFNFKDDATDAQIQNVVRAFGQLPEKIKTIQGYEWGTNTSPEGLNDGYTHCFQVTFKSEADRDAYLPHPEHQAFVQVLRPILEKVLVVDYWAHE